MSWELTNYAFINMDNVSRQSLCIDDLGLENRKNEAYSFNNTNRNYRGYLFQYTLDGYGIFEVQGVRYKLTKGKAFFITFPDDSRYYLSDDKNPDYHWTFFYIHFSGPAVEPFFNRIREISGPVLELDIDSIPVSLFLELLDTLKTKKQLGRYLGNEWLYRFLVSLLRSIEFPTTGEKSPHVVAAIEWMKRNYSKPINLVEMSKEIGVSYPHLTRQFCKDQGISPVQFLTHLRLESAMNLLLNTELSIDKIAEECGFSSSNYFTKVYKKVMRMTPGEYRKQHNLSL